MEHLLSFVVKDMHSIPLSLHDGDYDERDHYPLKARVRSRVRNEVEYPFPSHRKNIHSIPLSLHDGDYDERNHYPLKTRVRSRVRNKVEYPCFFIQKNIHSIPHSFHCVDYYERERFHRDKLMFVEAHETKWSEHLNQLKEHPLHSAIASLRGLLRT